MKNKKLNIAIFIGLVLAIVGGIFFPSIVKELSFLGTIYFNPWHTAIEHPLAIGSKKPIDDS